MVHLNLINMKFISGKIFIGIFYLSVCTFGGCEKESLLLEACGIDDPVENLPWLKEFIENTSTTESSSLTSIDLYEYGSSEIILASWQLIGIMDLPTGAIFNCSGDMLYHCGGNQPIDSCTIVINQSKLIGQLWKKNE